MTMHILGLCNLKYGHHNIFHLWKCKSWLVKTHMLHNIIHIQFFLGLVDGVLNQIELHLVRKQVPNCWHVWSMIHLRYIYDLCYICVKLTNFTSFLIERVVGWVGQALCSKDFESFHQMNTQCKVSMFKPMPPTIHKFKM
jgi:hypothetical protein